MNGPHISFQSSGRDKVWLPDQDSNLESPRPERGALPFGPPAVGEIAGTIAYQPDRIKRYGFDSFFNIPSSQAP